MEAKLFEIRDRATFIPVLAVRLASRTEAERYLLGRTGYGLTSDEQGRYVILTKLAAPSESGYDPNGWPNQRTLPTAHRHIIACWERLWSGDVVDVEFLLGETLQPKASERDDQIVKENP